MNKEWVEHNFAQIFPNQNPNLESNWRAALDGYSHIGTVYSVLYNLLKKNGDLDKVLDGIEHKQIRERIIDNIAISYLRGQESLDHRSLFAKILHGWKTEDISDVIGLFWQHRPSGFPWLLRSPLEPGARRLEWRGPFWRINWSFFRRGDQKEKFYCIK